MKMNVELVKDKNTKCPGGGMVDAVDSKSTTSNSVRVQVSPRAPSKF
jgi:hypothetical protein